MSGYCEAPKALYAWSCTLERSRDGESGWWHLLHDEACHDRLVGFATAHRFTRVYLYVGAVEWDWRGSFSEGTLPYADEVAVLTTRLRAAGIEPWALWYLADDPDDLAHTGRVDDLVDAVDAFGRTWPDGAFGGLHGDQEPNDPGVYDAYLEMTTAGRDRAVPLGLGWGAALKPAWLTTPSGDGTLIEEVLRRSTTGTLMDYTDDPAKAADRGETFLGFADALGRTGEVALETGTTDPTPGVSFADLVATDPDGFYDLIGELDASFSAHPSYDGIVIHDFAQYFAALNGGIGPYDTVSDLPTLCPPPATTTTTTPETTTPPAATPGTATPPTEPGCGCRTGSGVGWWAVLAIFGRRRRAVAA